MADGLIVRDENYISTPTAEIGGKAKGLGAILSRSLPCPPSFCVTTSALRDCFTRVAPTQIQPEDVPALVRNLSVPPELAQEIRAQTTALLHAVDGRQALAVRSSCVSEDAPGTLSPGIYHSEIISCSPDAVIAAVRRVWASAFTPEACEYRRLHGLPLYQLDMAVVVQRAPSPVAGGVVYTLLPDSGDAGALLIEFADGSPANVVENRVDVSSRVVSKRTRVVDNIPSGPFRAAHADRLVSWSLELERAHDAPLDLEWLLDEDGELWLLQARQLSYSTAPARTGRFVAEARGTSLRSAKLAPFRLAGDTAITTIPAALVLPEAFTAFKRGNGQVPPEVAAACESVFRTYLSRGPVSIRSVYWSALDSGDLMPQSGSLTNVADCLAHVVDFWRFIIEHGRDDYTAEVALLVCNWTDLRASVIATVPAAADSDVATVAALYGQLDGLESCTHDIYEIDLETKSTLRQTVPLKPRAVCVPGQPPQSVPVELQRLPVLDADEVAAVANDLSALRDTFGRARVEMLVLHRRGSSGECVVTWQVSPLTPVEARLRYFTVTRVMRSETGTAATGELIPVRGPEDIRRLFSRTGSRMVYIDFSRSSFRDTALANAMALDLKRANCPVLLRGSLLSHFAALLRDYGLTVYPIIESLEEVPAGSLVKVEALV
ncbi:PEP/pyruvate-binding domain-containing protein [Streptomyces sp. NPDC002928]|uniref:PEP/pyruvate-binding domain-containing protein n=1 Tax=Streptomyces sp. NPDC002928 TaxID=3154440 RepID=UPI0033A2D274